MAGYTAPSASSARLDVDGEDPTRVPLDVTGAPGQSADLARVVTTGGAGLIVGPSGRVYRPTLTEQAAVCNDAAATPLTVRGVTGQTADLLRVLNAAGTALLRVRASGGMVGAGAVPVSHRVGKWSCTPGGISTTVPPEAQLRAMPVPIGHALTIDGLGLEVTTAGTAGAVLRFGLYADTGSGFPGALLLDAGTVAATATGTAAITLAQPLAVDPGWLWVAGVVQGGATTRPQLRTVVGNALPVDLDDPSDTQATSVATAGVAGALPATFDAAATVIGGFRIAARVAALA